jgi:hypothetical protein
MSMEQLVECELAGRTEEPGENPPKCYFVHHKSHMISSGIELHAAEMGSWLDFGISRAESSGSSTRFLV